MNSKKWWFNIYDWLDDEQAVIIWGTAIDNSQDDMIRVSILIGK